MTTYSRAVITVVGIATLGCGSADMTKQQDVPKDGQSRFSVDDLVVTTESESRSRSALLPTTPTENARHVLGTIELPDLTPSDVERDYLPEPAIEWVVDVRLGGDPQLDPHSISDLFEAEWREVNAGFVEYGRDVATGRWTFLIAADGPKAVDQLKFGFDYIDVLDDEAPLAGKHQYVARLDQIRERMQRFGNATVRASLPPADAVRRARTLRDLKRDLDMTAVLILEAPAGTLFDGKNVWDVMNCLGLEWGDMDCFHWQNRSGAGDDSFFSVETTTPPGYFLPEQVAADRVHVADLVFLYSVPRCARPVEVFDAMSRAVDYCRTRLGGSVVTGEGEAVDTLALRRRIVEVSEKLRAAGFEPGTYPTLRLF